jgi:hypothetical protein
VQGSRDNVANGGEDIDGGGEMEGRFEQSLEKTTTTATTTAPTAATTAATTTQTSQPKHVSKEGATPAATARAAVTAGTELPTMEGQQEQSKKMVAGGGSAGSAVDAEGGSCGKKGAQRAAHLGTNIISGNAINGGTSGSIMGNSAATATATATSLDLPLSTLIERKRKAENASAGEQLRPQLVTALSTGAGEPVPMSPSQLLQEQMLDKDWDLSDQSIDCGYVFHCADSTVDECVTRGLFGAPNAWLPSQGTGDMCGSDCA